MRARDEERAQHVSRSVTLFLLRPFSAMHFSAPLLRRRQNWGSPSWPCQQSKTAGREGLKKPAKGCRLRSLKIKYFFALDSRDASLRHPLPARPGGFWQYLRSFGQARKGRVSFPPARSAWEHQRHGDSIEGEEIFTRKKGRALLQKKNHGWCLLSRTEQKSWWARGILIHALWRLHITWAPKKTYGGGNRKM